ncbi:MAG: FtsW/RodA/SpoVE family cell cycle protein, partial [Cyclobacteriaceae bacterium]|nr:FtsW/RodA/SpoVE family cell cycle protein [Cyclobacteriaceae bacterium]
PLPLVSMGGTSMLFTGISLGIILSVSRGEVDQSWNISKGTMHNIPKAA